MISRLVRDATLTCLAMTVAAFLWRPDQPRLGLGVLGGGALAGLSFWAIRGAVDRVLVRGETGEIGPISRTFQLVKFFTRHVILALVAYGMMVRLQLAPLGMIVGASAVLCAATVEAVRLRRTDRRQ